MARNRAQQRATRERMAETGENYTTARTALLSGPLYLLTITTKHGDSHELYTSENAAKDAVYDYVVQYWSEVDRSSTPVPEDKDEAIALYFEDSPEDDWTIEPISVSGAPAPKGPEPLDVNKLDLSTLDKDELLKLVRRVNDEYDSRSESSFVDLLRAALAAESDIQELVAKHGPVVRAEFETWDWDNGWFFNEHSPKLAFADGTIYDGVEIEHDGEYSHGMANVSQAYQPLGASAVYTVDLVTGDTEQDDYGDNAFPTGRKVEETTVVHIGNTPGEQYGWECADCDEISGLQWGSESNARKALDNHVKELHPTDEETE